MQVGMADGTHIGAITTIIITTITESNRRTDGSEQEVQQGLTACSPAAAASEAASEAEAQSAGTRRRLTGHQPQEEQARAAESLPAEESQQPVHRQECQGYRGAP